ncbi:MAG: hypothetical protein Q8O13_10735 [Candidatus Omnitrophota bacterium]|nr:hypothetical protein [Candidatus Omnitrophota bacterium]
MFLKYETLAKFISKRGGEIYFVKRKLATGELSCNCRGWLYYRHCKHIDYCYANSFIELTDIPTYQEALRMDWGKNLEEKEKWTVTHLKAIEL